MKVKGKLIEADWNILHGRPPAVLSVPELPDALAAGVGEQIFQESLSRHSEYLPNLAGTHHGIWFNWILYKHRLPSGNEVDFAYVETTSAQNTVVLIEIEDPAKKMWVGPEQKPGKSVEFNRAIEQVTRWRTDLQDPVQFAALRADFSKMMGDSGKVSNTWKIVYGLVYGRSSENNSAERKAAYVDTQDNLGIKLMTFDNLVERHKNFPGRAKNVMRVSYPGPTFSYLYLNAPPRSEFGYLGSGRLILEKESREVIASLGYDLDAWEKGELLIINDKFPKSHIGLPRRP